MSIICDASIGRILLEAAGLQYFSISRVKLGSRGTEYTD